MTRVAITGAAGRMGRTLIEAIGATPGIQLCAATEHPASDAIGTRIETWSASDTSDTSDVSDTSRARVIVTDDLASVVDDFDTLIDFSIPQASLAALETCRANGKRMVIGTTGFEQAGLDAIREAAQAIAIMMAPNMSVGVNVAFKLIELAARALGDDVDVEVFEAHHRHKIDAPSGTAVRMGEILAAALGRDIATDAVYGRQGITGERERKTIGFHSLRGGDIVGEHTVSFIGTGERIEVTHRAQSRMNFAMGAMRAVRFIDGKDSGLFTMDDVLSL